MGLIQISQAGSHPINATELESLPHVPGRGYGIVRVDEFPSDWAGSTYAGTKPVEDRLFGKSKGEPIQVLQSMWGYLPKINHHPDAMKLLYSEGWWWVNIKYTPPEIPKCECMAAPGNVVAWDNATYTHREVLSYDYTIDTKNLDPAIDNFRYRPDIFQMATSYDRGGNIFKIGAGIEAFVPHLRATPKIYIHKDDIWEFPVGPKYRFADGGNKIYDDTILLMSYVNGVRVFHTNWTIPVPTVPYINWS